MITLKLKDENDTRFGIAPNGSSKNEAIPTRKGPLDFRLILLYKSVHGIGSQE